MNLPILVPRRAEIALHIGGEINDPARELARERVERILGKRAREAMLNFGCNGSPILGRGLDYRRHCVLRLHPFDRLPDSLRHPELALLEPFKHRDRQAHPGLRGRFFCQFPCSFQNR